MACIQESEIPVHMDNPSHVWWTATWTDTEFAFIEGQITPFSLV
jgi:hypothetical protein